MRRNLQATCEKMKSKSPLVPCFSERPSKRALGAEAHANPSLHAAADRDAASSRQEGSFFFLRPCSLLRQQARTTQVSNAGTILRDVPRLHSRSQLSHASHSIRSLCAFADEHHEHRRRPSDRGSVRAPQGEGGAGRHQECCAL